MKRQRLLSFCFFFLTAGPTFAQAVAGLGGVSGTVRDASGASVPGATVVISNDAKGIKRTMTTTDAGTFNAPALVPSGGYSITVSSPGFSNWEVKNFEILVGQTIDFKVALQVTSTGTTVEVSGEAPLVEDSKTGVSQVVEKDQIDNLPINGRRADTFVLLTPAVTNDGEFGLVSFRGIAAGNSFLTDGNDTTQAYYNENAGRTRISTQISQDAVQEFQVLSNGFTAEFGRAMGGVINTVTRSGSNDLHGTGYWFFRNRTLNASDRYANGFNLPEWRHQGGASLGGPVKKDKIFYFANFEFVKRNFPGLNRIVSNSLSDPTGNFIPPSTCTATAAQCAAAINFVQKQMNVLVPRTVNSAMGFGKIDWRPTDRNSFSFSANVMHWKSPHGIQTQAVLNSGNALGNNANSTVETRYGKASWTSVPSSSSVNEFRFGWFKDRLSDSQASDLFPAETGPLNISLASQNVGSPQAYPRTLPSEQRFQLVDNYSWTRGAHSAKFGVDYSTNEDYIDQLFNRYGSYTYANITSFARDFSGNSTILGKNYSNFTQAFGTAKQDFRTSDIAFYAQDNWKVTRRLLVNYGIRYEHTWLPQPWTTNPDYAATGKIHSPTKNFGPRFGMTYSPSERTVIRAGYGIFWGRFPGNGLDTLLLGNGLFQPNILIQNTVPGAPVFPNIFASPAGLPSGTVNLQYAAADFHNPYTQQGNIAIEHQLTRNLAVTISYIWSRGIGMWTQRDMNLAAPTQSVTYAINDAANNSIGSYTTPVYTSKVDSRYGKILLVDNGGQSWYNGLVIQVRKRLSHGFTGSASYTWSHAIDDGDEQGANWNIGWNFNNATFNGNYPLDKGSSTLDQRHRAVFNFQWEPHITSSNSTAARYFINGWQLSGITTLASAHPVSATVNVSGTQFAGVFLAYNTTLNGSGGWNRVPFWPVSSLDIDRIYRVDARLARSLPFSERIKATLMFEAFNAFNTITNTNVNTQAYAATNGVLRPTANLGNGTASQGFPDGTNARRMQVAVRLVF